MQGYTKCEMRQLECGDVELVFKGIKKKAVTFSLPLNLARSMRSGLEKVVTRRQRKVVATDDSYQRSRFTSPVEATQAPRTGTGKDYG